MSVNRGDRPDDNIVAWIPGRHGPAGTRLRIVTALADKAVIIDLRLMRSTYGRFMRPQPPARISPELFQSHFLNS
jgi:hypothetical protein